MDVSDEWRILLFGKTGVGKSSLANTILGQSVFPINHCPNAPKASCQVESMLVDGRTVTVMDTPGFFDLNMLEKELKREILNSVSACPRGINALIIVLKVEKLTEQEDEVVRLIEEFFSPEAFNFSVVVFTHGDQLGQEMTIQSFVSHSKRLTALVQRCGGRCHVVDNRYWSVVQQDEYRSNTYQVRQLLNTLEKMIKDNERASIHPELQAAKNNGRFWTRVAGIGAGVILGAALGGLGGCFVLKTLAVAGGVMVPYVTAIIGAGAGGVKGARHAECSDTPAEAAGNVVAAAEKVGLQLLSGADGEPVGKNKKE